MFLQDSVQNVIRISGGRINNLKQKKLIDKNPEKVFSYNDFIVSLISYVRIKLFYCINLIIHTLFYRLMTYVYL